MAVNDPATVAVSPNPQLELPLHVTATFRLLKGLPSQLDELRLQLIALADGMADTTAITSARAWVDLVIMLEECMALLTDT